MYYRKKTTYPGRWLVKLMEAGLIFGIIFFTVDALQGAFAPEPYAEPLVIHHVQPVEVVRVEPQVVQPQVQAAPEYTDYDYFVMAYNHQTAAEYYEAIVDYTRVLELNPDFDSAWLNRGVAYEQLNNDYRAMQDFNRFMLREGTSIVSHRGILTGARLDVEMTENLIYALNFYARAGETLDISVTAQNGDVVDPLVLVVNADGSPVVAKDDTLRQDGSLISMDAHITNFEALSTGRYTLLISHAGGGSDGTLQLELEISR
jgi:tetratricopeptide (TPR) repeat protein